MIHLPLDTIYEILYYLHNGTIMQIPYVCTYLNAVVDNTLFKEYIMYRPHPMVFNLVDNYCRICNFGYPFPFSNYDKKYVHCSHI